MSGVDVHISINNAPQIERHQSENKQTPLVYQDQNQNISKRQIEKRIRMPVAPEETVGKKIDPKNRKDDEKKQKKRSQSKTVKRRKKRRKPNNGGFFVDTEA
ncbi:hypothetical protein QA601_12315 [Chitinispirillales bacterium ANBcel5]|uniref:hypothetical protein n=1 Tax=Cellulosispirillum alkaliphilum TaxID=3039283 RepID=UPI002A585D47|nr:hypothetical protein [Chitinispirillales bacterium ANBcel5]